MFTYFFIMMLAEFFLRTNELSTTAKPACIIMILKQLPKSHEESGAGRNCWHLGSSEGTQLRRSLSDQLSVLSHQPCPCPATPPLCSPHGSVSSAIPACELRSESVGSTAKSKCCCLIWQRKGTGTKSISVIAKVAWNKINFSSLQLY